MYTVGSKNKYCMPSDSQHEIITGEKEITLTLKCCLDTLIAPADPPTITDAAKQAYTGHNTEKAPVKLKHLS